MLRRVMMAMGNTYFRSGNLRMARMASRAEEPRKPEKLEPEPEYKKYESVDEIQKEGREGQVHQDKRWMINDHLSASDEINQRGIEQRAKELGISVEKLEELRPWEHNIAESTGTYKQTVLQGGAGKGPQRGTDGYAFHEGANIIDRASETRPSSIKEKASDIKNTNQDTTRTQVDKTTKDQGLTADEEIKRRGIEQRSKEWGIPIEKLEELKPWEHHPSQSNPEAYKETILKSKEKKGNVNKGYRARSNFTNQEQSEQSQQQSAQNQQQNQQNGNGNFESGVEFNDLASGKVHWYGEKLGVDIKYTDKPTGVNTYQQNPQADKLKDQHAQFAGEGGQVKNAQNTTDAFDQSMVDRAMSWVKDKFGGSGSAGKEGKDRMEGPMGDHNALNKGEDSHTDYVHKATFTRYEDSEKPFSSSVEEGQKKTQKKEKVKDYLSQQ